MQEISYESLARGHRLAKAVGFAMVASVFVYAVIAEYLYRENAHFAGFSPQPEETFSLLRMILFGISLFDFALIPIVKKSVLKKESRGGTPGFPEPVSRLISASLVSLALCESIAIYGLVLFLLNGGRQDFYLFTILSVTAFAVHFPRIGRWRGYLEEMGWVVRD